VSALKVATRAFDLFVIHNYKVATLSCRGYKEKSEGFILANSNVNAEIFMMSLFSFTKKISTIQVKLGCWPVLNTFE
jgi:hypothetical protein